MITGYPLFRGRDNADQLVQIMKIVGTPSNETLAQIKHDSVCALNSTLGRRLTYSLRSKSRLLSLGTRSSLYTPSSPRLLVMVSQHRSCRRDKLIIQPSTYSRVYFNSNQTVVMMPTRRSPTHTLPRAQSRHLPFPIPSLHLPHRLPSRHE